MTGRHAVLGVVAVAVALAGCRPADDGHPDAELGPAEVFRWGGQPISISTPPAGWRAERSQNGGTEGVRFIRTGSVGEEIAVEEYFAFDRRDRCDELRDLLAGFDEMDHSALVRAVPKARPYAAPALNEREAALVEAANERLGRVLELARAGDRVGARWALEEALERVTAISYAVADVAAKARYTGDGLPAYIRAEVGEPTPIRLGDLPAERTDYALEYSGRTYRGRRVAVEYNNRLFVVRFQGLEENLPLFERVLATVTFPAGDCTHP